MSVSIWKPIFKDMNCLIGKLLCKMVRQEIMFYFFRSFDCMRIGDQGVKIVKPEDGGDLPLKPGNDAIIDSGNDEIEDYDENLIRKIV